VIIWGDGTPATFGRVGVTSKGVFFVAGTHRYRQRGVFPITVLVSSRQGEHGLAVGRATVAARGGQVQQGLQATQQAATAPIAIAPMPVAPTSVHDLALQSLTARKRRS